jgi:hypothetical protein
MAFTIPALLGRRVREREEEVTEASIAKSGQNTLSDGESVRLVRKRRLRVGGEVCG